MRWLFLLLLPSLSLAGAVIKNDQFTEASDTALQSHTSDSGGGWQGTEVSLQVEGATNSLENTVGTGRLTAVGDEAPSETDYYNECEVVLNGTATTDRAFVLVRGQDGATHSATASSFYALRLTGGTVGNVAWNMYRYDSGAPDTTPGDCATDCTGTLASVDSDDTVKLKIQVSGTGATVTVLVYTDENIDGGGYSGYTLRQTILDTDGNRITTAGNVGAGTRNTNARINWCYSEDLTGGIVPVVVTSKRRRVQ